MTTETQRQLIFFIFIFVIMFVGSFLLHFTIFENLVIVCLAAMVMKLTDIQDAINKLK